MGTVGLDMFTEIFNLHVQKTLRENVQCGKCVKCMMQIWSQHECRISVSYVVFPLLKVPFFLYSPEEVWWVEDGLGSSWEEAGVWSTLNSRNDKPHGSVLRKQS